MSSTSTNPSPSPQLLIPKTIHLSLAPRTQHLNGDLRTNWDNFFVTLDAKPEWKTQAGYLSPHLDRDHVVKLIYTAHHKCTTPEEADAKTDAAIEILREVGFKPSRFDVDSSKKRYRNLDWSYPKLEYIKREIPDAVKAIEEEKGLSVERFYCWPREFDYPDPGWLEYLECFKERKAEDLVPEKEADVKTEVESGTGEEKGLVGEEEEGTKTNE